MITSPTFSLGSKIRDKYESLLATLMMRLGEKNSN
jgi:hypothetical protein